MSNENQSQRQAWKGLELGRFVISVDGQRTIGFSDRASANAAAAQLTADFPHVTVVVSDQEDAIIRERN